MKPGFSLTLVLPLLLAAPVASAAIIQFTDRTAFLAALSPGYFSTSFAALPAGDQGVSSLNVSSGSPALNLTFSSRNAANTGPGDFLYLASLGNVDRALGNTTTVSDQLVISAPSLFAIGGDWFLTDFNEDYFAGTVNLTFSDSSTFSVSSTSQASSFRGYISDTPLTNLRISADPNPATDRWVTVDNLVAVPEPGSAAMLGLAVAGSLARRRRGAG